MDDRQGGKLTIFLGSAAGVGKTYAMLSEGKQQLKSGVDVVVGFVETHGREDTLEMIGPLPVVPRRKVEYRGRSFEEMDTDVILGRRPRLVLIDELAHTNVPGSPHKKRYEDIEQILDAGIDVWTTVNIQHLESLNVMVYELTGVKVRETFPDNVLERADQIRLIDISPEALIERLKAGKVYPPGKIETALSNFFQKSNLSALRELSLREVAEEVEETIEEEEAPDGAFQDRVVLCLGPETNAQKLIRRGWRMARRMNAELVVVYVKEAGSRAAVSLSGDRDEQERVDALRNLSGVLGAEFLQIGARGAADAIVTIIREKKAGHVIMSKPRTGRLNRKFREPLFLQVLEKAGDVEMHLTGDEEGTTVPGEKS